MVKRSDLRRVRQRDVPAHHLAGMRHGFPGFAPRHLRSGGIEWSGSLQPSPDSPEYRVRIVHAHGKPPKVFIVGLQAKPRPPHLYADGSLCLYWPVEWRWGPHRSLADTIVPWAALWLYYYEAWLLTGEWLGPSSPHSSRTPKAAP